MKNFEIMKDVYAKLGELPIGSLVCISNYIALQEIGPEVRSYGVLLSIKRGIAQVLYIKWHQKVLPVLKIDIIFFHSTLLINPEALHDIR